jgi:hypothetical protein
MNTWSEDTYGDPCRECGFSFGISMNAAISTVTAAPERYGRLVTASTGFERHPELGWSVSGYVCHVGDNTRIWAERYAGVVDGPREIAPYDENLLATARSYDKVPLVAAMWSLKNAVVQWREIVEEANRRNVVILHPERGELSVLDAVGSNTHDVVHHEWDIRRSLEFSRARRTITSANAS